MAVIPKSGAVDIDRFVASLRGNPDGLWLRRCNATGDASQAQPRLACRGLCALRGKRITGSCTKVPASLATGHGVLRQADLILLVASASDDPALSEPEQTLLFGETRTSSAPVELVLLHADAGQLPSNSARFLSPGRWACTTT